MCGCYQKKKKHALISSVCVLTFSSMILIKGEFNESNLNNSTGQLMWITHHIKAGIFVYSHSILTDPTESFLLLLLFFFVLLHDCTPTLWTSVCYSPSKKNLSFYLMQTQKTSSVPLKVHLSLPSRRKRECTESFRKSWRKCEGENK